MHLQSIALWEFNEFQTLYFLYTMQFVCISIAYKPINVHAHKHSHTIDNHQLNETNLRFNYTFAIFVNAIINRICLRIPLLDSVCWIPLLHSVCKCSRHNWNFYANIATMTAESIQTKLHKSTQKQLTKSWISTTNY